MATESRNILKSYFKTGKYPTEGQFAKLIDSFVHKNDQIGMSSIEGLAEALNGKADKATIDLKDYAEAGKVLPLGGCYLYYGMPTHARTLDALDTDFDPEATEGDTTQVVVFCCGHSDGDNSGKGALYLVYGSTNSGYAYYASFTHQNVPEDILRAFGEAVATTYADGLMSKKDKEKLEATIETVPLGYYRHGDVLPTKALIYSYAVIPPALGVLKIAEERYMYVDPEDTNGGYEAYDDPPVLRDGKLWCRVLHVSNDLYTGVVHHFYWIFDENNRYLCRYYPGQESGAPDYIRKAFWLEDDKQKLDKVKVLDIAKFCRSGGELPQEGMDCNIFMHNGKLVEMRQWDSNSQKFMAFATLSLGDVEEKALGTAPMEYRQSYYVFRDDDNGYYEYLTAYGYSNVPMNIARAFHGEETSEAVNDIFSI